MPDHLPRLTRWLGFATYQASTETYQESILPGGSTAGAPQQALDCACGLYLADPAAWT